VRLRGRVIAPHEVARTFDAMQARVRASSIAAAACAMCAMCAMCAFASLLGAQRTVSANELLNPPAGEWLNHGRAYDNQRFSPLTQVTTANVAQLVPVAAYQMNVDRAAGLEATPIVAGGVLYMTTSYDNVLAFDLRTNRRLWQYNHRLGTAIFCCGPVNRGVAVVGDKVFVATLDAHLVALDARTGRVQWDITTHSADSGYSHTSAPLVVGNKVIIGVAGGEYGIRGNVTAYDVETGKQIWRFHAVPSPAEGGWWGKWSPSTPWGDKLPRNIAAEKADSAKYPNAWKIGGSPVWVTPAYDAELGLIYFGTGNPSPSNDGVGRPGDNLYNNSTVAVDVQSGKLRWYVQHIPHDLWDYDIPNPPILATVGGRKVVMHAGKEGWVYVMDAATGERVRRTEAFVPQAPMFLAPNDSGILMRPGIFGGANWPPSSFSPQTGFMYVPARDRPTMATREEQPYETGKMYIGGSQRPVRGHVPTGMLAAVDIATGKIAWSAERETQVWGGTLATAGGLVFMGETGGWIRAYDARDVRVLWSFFCGAGVDGSPISYELDGRQYIAVPAGGSWYSQLRGNSLFIFALGGAQAPATGRGGSAPSSASAPSRGASGAPAPRASVSDLPPGASRVNRFMGYDSTKRVVYLNVTAAFGANNGGMSFNGASGGAGTMIVPRGWTVTMRFTNQDKIAHSVIVIRDTRPLPITPDTPAIAGAVTSNPAVGMPAGEDLEEEVTFVARDAGQFLLACGVPAHTPSGMWLRFTVDAAATKPSYQ
jgi:PQQ-dependent dehydrogenase (methanol/ethanol family)